MMTLLRVFRANFLFEDAYLVSFKLRDYPDCECWERGRCVIKTDVRAGATYLYDLKRDPRFVIDKPYHSIFFYLPRSAPDGHREPGRRKAHWRTRLSARCRPRRRDRSSLGNVDPARAASAGRGQSAVHRSHHARNLGARIPQAYGGSHPGSQPPRGGLAPWQTKRACERMEFDLGGTLSLQRIAAEFDLSVSHFSRAFRISTWSAATSVATSPAREGGQTVDDPSAICRCRR